MKIGPVVVAHDVESDCIDEETDLISNVVVLLAVVDEDGDERLVVTGTPGVSFLTKAGMVSQAQEVVRGTAS